MTIFSQLSRANLLSLANGLEQERIPYPTVDLSLVNYLSLSLCQPVAQELTLMFHLGATREATIYFLRQLAQIQLKNQNIRDCLELVWTGPEIPGTGSRDTAVVVQELFTKVTKKLILSSFAIDKGAKAKQLFQFLAQRMDAIPELEVKMFLNIQRPYQSEISESILLREFAQNFRDYIWTGKRFPLVFYDSRSLSVIPKQQSCLHAKCIVVDEQEVFISSANFTQAAHQRNIEAGVLIQDQIIAQQLIFQFEKLIDLNLFKIVPGLIDDAS